MKKTLFAVLALAAVAACNKAEVVEQNPANAIAFDNVFVDNATKSVHDPSFTNDKLFTDFAVFGFVEGASLFNNVTVSEAITNTELTKSTWKYEGTQYWIAGAKYNFSAVAPKTNGNWTNATASAEGVSFDFTNNGETDVLYAQTPVIEGNASGNDVVGFTFRHILSKVKLSFENGYNASSATLRVENVKIENAFATGKVELKGETTTWGTHAGVLELAFGMATDSEATNDKENTEVAYAYGETYETQKELFLIPGAVPTKNITVDETTTTVNGYYVSFDVVLLVSGKEIDTYHHTASVDFTPEAGKCYDIKATVTASNIDPDHAQEPIEFTVTALNDWTAANPNPEF